jgi:hypothetical protein
VKRGQGHCPPIPHIFIIGQAITHVPLLQQPPLHWLIPLHDVEHVPKLHA